MNRWLGSKGTSDKQASERNSRAARRTIAGLPVPLVLSDDDEFQDCDTSLLFSTDGAGDKDSDSLSTSSDGAMADAELARQRALPVSEADFAT